MALRTLDRTPWIRLHDRSSADTGTPDPGADGRDDGAAAAAAFLDRRWRLPTCAHTYAFHGLANHGPIDSRLADILRPLQGKFTVVNHAVVVPLPPAARRRAARLVGAACDRARRHRRPILVTLAEEQRPVIRHEAVGAGAAADPGPDVRFSAALRYRLGVTLGDPARDEDERSDGARGPDGTDSLGVSRPWPWFDIPVLVPDADAMQLMAVDTRQLYRSITGRLGPGSRDSYWYAESWERYHEPGRIAGCIQPLAVECAAARESGSPAPARPGPGDGDDHEAFLYGGPGSAERSRWTEYSAATQHRLFVPPGYCLVRFACWVELGVSRGPAAIVD